MVVGQTSTLANGTVVFVIHVMRSGLTIDIAVVDSCVVQLLIGRTLDGVKLFVTVFNADSSDRLPVYFLFLVFVDDMFIDRVTSWFPVNVSTLVLLHCCISNNEM
jgi:hypothetical protein